MIKLVTILQLKPCPRGRVPEYLLIRLPTLDVLKFQAHSFPPFFPSFQTCSDMTAMKKRALQYVMPVAVLSLLFNVPKFFESKVVVKDVERFLGTDAATGKNITEIVSSTLLWIEGRI